jgi:RNA polymerase sigma factor (sigma-70 family)
MAIRQLVRIVGWPENWPLSRYASDQDKDSEIIERFQNGNKFGFHDLFIQYWGYVWYTCHNITHDDELAEEAAQNTFIEFLRREKSNPFDGRIKFGTYLATIARYESFRVLTFWYDNHKGKREAQICSLDSIIDEGHSTLKDIIDNTIYDNSPSTDEVIDYNDLYDHFIKCLSQLPDRTAHIIRERVLKNRTLEDIGNDLGISRERVRQVEEQGRLRLHKKFNILGLTERKEEND